jgi:hypothetical protein
MPFVANSGFTAYAGLIYGAATSFAELQMYANPASARGPVGCSRCRSARWPGAGLRCHGEARANSLVVVVDHVVRRVERWVVVVVQRVVIPGGGAPPCAEALAEVGALRRDDVAMMSAIRR